MILNLEHNVRKKFIDKDQHIFDKRLSIEQKLYISYIKCQYILIFILIIMNRFYFRWQ